LAREQRRLAAIVSADVAGYSRLMGQDESGTLAALTTIRRDVVEPKIAAHGGRIVKTTGDGLLLEFASVVDAVRCVIEIQTALATSNVDVAGAGRIAFRFGVNQGDIISVDDDIFGDGVNVAARLQEKADPGGLCISGRVQEDLLGKFDLGLRDLGALSLKNIARQVRAWAWSSAPPGAAAGPLATVGGPVEKSDQKIAFCRAPDGVQLAYATVGQGPPLVKAGGFLAHLEHDWETWGDILSTLASDRTVIRYDARGTGLSDWDVEEFSFEAWVNDLESVVDAIGLSRFPLIAFSQGCALAVAYAVRHPERVSHLILYGGYAAGNRKVGEEKRQQSLAMETLMRSGWHAENPAYRQIFTTQFMPKATKAQADAFNTLLLKVSSPERAAQFIATAGEIDVRDLLAQVRVPTLVLHARDDKVVPLEAGRQLAAGIPGARFVSFSSESHIFMHGEPSAERFFEEIRLFLGK
jgi:class 3 adenylate cyclase/pimeloyl-ACP methyl ester carboxylesterase